MEPGQIVHIAVTVVAILSAAAAALLCDLLRTENVRLRRTNIALLADRKEHQRRLGLERGRGSATVEVVASITSSLPLSIEGGNAEREAGVTRRVRIASEQGVGLLNGRVSNGVRDAGGFTERGQTLEEARELARNLLAATARNGRAKAANGSSAGDPERANSSQEGVEERVFRRRNWGVLLKPPGEQPAGEGGESPGAASPSHKPDLIAFESLNPYTVDATHAPRDTKGVRG